MDSIVPLQTVESSVTVAPVVWPFVVRPDGRPDGRPVARSPGRPVGSPARRPVGSPARRPVARWPVCARVPIVVKSPFVLTGKVVTVMEVLVMVAVDPNCESNLQIVMVAQPEGEARVSQIVTLKGAVPSRAGNPYLVYGDAVEKFTGCNRFDTTISVFDCSSGDFSGWLGFDFPTPPIA